MTKIGDEAFARRASLTSIDIPEGVTSIGECAFYDCSNLESIIIPNSVTSIGGLVFFDYVNPFFTIYGVPGSCAETYASEYNILFRPINEFPDQSDNSDIPIVTLDSKTPRQITLTWKAIYGSKGYSVYRSETENSEKKLLTFGLQFSSGVCQYKDTDFDFENIENIAERYYYFVTSIKSDGTESDFSKPVYFEPRAEIQTKPTVSGKIEIVGGDSSSPVTIAVLDASGNPVTSATSEDGTYSFSDLPDGTYTIQISRSKCAPRSLSVTVDGTPLSLDTELRLYGDVDGDGKIEASDATQILKLENELPSVFDNIS